MTSTPMPAQPRAFSARTALASRVLALMAFSASALTRHTPGFVLAMIGLGLLVIPVAWRNKAASVPGAVYSGSADLVKNRRQFPGQLSVTDSGLFWIPSSYSEATWAGADLYG